MVAVYLKYLEEEDYPLWLEGFSKRLPSQNPFDDGLLDMSICTKDWFADLVIRHRELREKDQQYIWGIYDAQTRRHVGMVNLAVLARADFQWAEIGYSIHNQYWRQGYASSMLDQLKEAAVKLGFHRLEAHVHPENIPSQALLKKSDFYLEGIRKNFQKAGEEWQDREVYVWIESDVSLD